jgi:type IV fimbrial biogenesis protein FimT/type IV fimbrial biogenesis protein FimU
MKVKGFTLVELMIGIAITGILVMLASPALSSFIVKLRVDNEIGEMHRLALMTRNQAISTVQSVTLCPLDSSNKCINSWADELTLFTDANNNRVFESGLNEEIIQIRSALTNSDQLTFSATSLTYTPEGRTRQQGTFRYCPKDYDKYSRALIVSLSGRMYQSSDRDDDGRDEDSQNNNVSCL